MSRAIRAAGLCLTAGMALTVLVSVTLAVIVQRWSSIGSVSNLFADGLMDGHVELRALSAEHHRTVTWQRYSPHWGARLEGFGYGELTFLSLALQPRFVYDMSEVVGGAMDAEGIKVIEIEAGWPMRAMRLAERFEFSAEEFMALYTTYTMNQPAQVASTVEDRFIIPTTPMWSGLLLNSLFYGAAIGVMVFVPGAIRRGLRKRRGRCPNCGYDVRGAFGSGCPECGWGRD